MSEDRAMSDPDLDAEVAALLADSDFRYWTEAHASGQRALRVIQRLAAPRAATEPPPCPDCARKDAAYDAATRNFRDVTDEMDAALATVLEAADAYLDPQNQYTESRLHALKVAVAEARAALTSTSAPEPM